MKFFKKIFNQGPAPDLEAAQRALESTLPDSMQQEIEHANAEMNATIMAVADDLQVQLTAWQREALVKVLSEPVVAAADNGDEYARMQIRSLGFFLEPKFKVRKDESRSLTYVMWRILPESKRKVEVSRIRFKFDNAGHLEGHDDESEDD